MINDNSQLIIKNIYASRLKSNNDKAILKNISFTASSGKITVLAGPNGAGKSSLLSLISGTNDETLQINSGNIFLNANEILKLKQKNRSQQISILTQNENNAWNLCVKDYILQGRFPYTNFFGTYSQNDFKKTCQIIDLLELTELKDKNIFNLSGGELQKIRIARALVQEPQVLLLDEPGENLDFVFQHQILSYIKKITKEKNIITIITIHDLNITSFFADNLFLLGQCTKQKNQITYFDTPQNLLKPEILKSIYNADFEIYNHPKFNIPQICLI